MLNARKKQHKVQGHGKLAEHMRQCNTHDRTDTSNVHSLESMSRSGNWKLEPRVAAKLPASAGEKNSQGSAAFTVSRPPSGEAEPGRAGAEATAHACVTNFTRRFQDYSGGPLSVAPNFFLLHRNPIYETHYNSGVAELQCNHSLMRLLRSSTRAARASAVRFLFVFRRILQVRVILQVLTHRVPKRT